MKTILWIGVAVVLLVGGFFAFGTYTAPQAEPPRVAENPDGEADPSRMTLGMTTWVWQSAHYNDGRNITPKKAGAFTLTFGEDGKFAATTDCNSMGGRYHAQEDSIVFEDIYQTEMFCEGSQETEFAQLLQNTSHYHFTGRGELILDLKFDSGSAVFR